MSIFFKLAGPAVAAVMVAGLAGCGGDTAGNGVETPGFTDTFVGTLTGSNGIWSGDAGGDGGSGDGGGAAGDGEFVRFSFRFPYTGAPVGTLTWTVTRSQYGILGNTGTLSISKDTSDKGGYKVVAVNGGAVRATQSNIFVSASGQLSGTWPLPFPTGTEDSVFNGTRLKDSRSTATDMSEYAGTYALGFKAANVLTGAAPDVSPGAFRLNANGAGRLCYNNGFVWSANCANGLDVLATFEDANSRDLIRIRQAATQSGTIAAGFTTGVDILAVARKYGASGVSFTGDVVATIPAQSTRTGAIYASRTGAAALNRTAFDGVWSLTSRPIFAPAPYVAKVAIRSRGDGSQTNSQGLIGANTCTNVVAVSAEPTANGTLTTTDNGQKSFSILVDADMAVNVVPGQELGMLRRYSSDLTLVSNACGNLPG